MWDWKRDLLIVCDGWLDRGGLFSHVHLFDWGNRFRDGVALVFKVSQLTGRYQFDVSELVEFYYFD